MTKVSAVNDWVKDNKNSMKARKSHGGSIKWEMSWLKKDIANVWGGHKDDTTSKLVRCLREQQSWRWSNYLMKGNVVLVKVD